MRPEYLHELLQDNKTVIVPGLGAFVNTGTASQPYLFNEYLKFNDGLLASFIAKRENISIEDAGKKLEVFAGGMKSLLDSGRDVIVNKIGRLKKDTEGKISFTCEPDLEVKVIEPAPEVPITIIEKEIVPEKETKLTPEIPPLPKEKPIEPVLHAPQKITVVTAKEEKKEDPKKEKKTVEKKKEKSGKKKSRVLLFILLFIVIGGGGTTGFLFREQLNQWFSSIIGKTETKQEEKKPETKSSTVNSDSSAVAVDTLTNPVSEPDSASIVVPEETPEVKSEPVPVAVSTPPAVEATSGDFYVIVGCYSNEANVNAMIEKANAKGLSGMNLGNFGGLTHVAVYQSSDLSDAAKKAMEIRSDFPNAWVFSKR